MVKIERDDFGSGAGSMGPGEENKWDAIMVALQLTTPVIFLVVVAVRARMLVRKVWKMTSKLTSKMTTGAGGIEEADDELFVQENVMHKKGRKGKVEGGSEGGEKGDEGMVDIELTDVRKE